jgi:hypothetical protein
MQIEKQAQTNKIQTVNRLTNAQLVILTAAARRDDGYISPRDGKADAAFSRTVGALLRQGLVDEAPVLAGQPCWRRDENDRAFGALITQQGLAALGIVPVEAIDDAQVGPDAMGNAPREASVGEGDEGCKFSKPSTKRALIIGLLQRSGGASLDELIKATGWLPHTTRAALTGLRQKGYVLHKSQGSEGKPTYRIVSARPDAAGLEANVANAEVRTDGDCADATAATANASQAA